jgi:tRNA modification GTPase
MEFIHEPYQPGDTIAAIATPSGDGGVAIVRISGNKAIEVADLVFSGSVRSYKSHTVHYGQILDAEKNRVDDVLLLVMLGKNSYTGEDTVEVHCHGGRLITKKVLETILKAGARAAKPGEFSFRAFINSKIDLAQAEAVQELILAKNEHALNAAEEQLQGTLSKKITHFQKQITEIAAILEAWVDFPEEGLEFTSNEELISDLKKLCQQMAKLAATFHNGRLIREGISVCFIGRPNVGKSSLMNALLDKERAIVSPIPGTTRDILEDDLNLNGLNLRLIDTAGIRHTEEIIEQEGVRRSKQAMNSADLVLCVLDMASGLHHEDHAILSELPKQKTILAWNKKDIAKQAVLPLDFPHAIAISAKERLGIEELQEKINDVIWQNGPPERGEAALTNLRHKEALIQAIASAEKVIEGLQHGVSPEFLTMDIRQCLKELGKIIGTNITEDILSSIFSKFCIGK